MGKMKDLVMDIEAMLDLGHSYETIARQLDIPVQWVVDTADRMDYDDSMDGDAASALASAGLGTDEDYGYYGGDEF